MFEFKYCWNCAGKLGTWVAQNKRKAIMVSRHTCLYFDVTYIHNTRAKCTRREVVVTMAFKNFKAHVKYSFLKYVTNTFRILFAKLIHLSTIILSIEEAVCSVQSMVDSLTHIHSDEVSILFNTASNWAPEKSTMSSWLSIVQPTEPAVELL